MVDEGTLGDCLRGATYEAEAIICLVGIVTSSSSAFSFVSHVLRGVMEVVIWARRGINGELGFCDGVLGADGSIDI